MTRRRGGCCGGRLCAAACFVSAARDIRYLRPRLCRCTAHLRTPLTPRSGGAKSENRASQASYAGLTLVRAARARGGKAGDLRRSTKRRAFSTAASILRRNAVAPRAHQAARRSRDINAHYSRQRRRRPQKALTPRRTRRHARRRQCGVKKKNHSSARTRVPSFALHPAPASKPCESSCADA